MRRLLLPISLSLNVFLAVVVGTLVLRHSPPPHPSRIVEEVAAILPPADAAILRQSFTPRIAELEATEAEMRQMPEHIAAALVQPDFDPEALRDVFAHGRTLHARKDTAIEEAMVQAVSQMSAEGRKRLSEWRPPGPPPRR